MFAKATLFIGLICLTIHSNAQNAKRNSTYIELGGNAVFYSVNYDRIIPLNNQIKLAPRIGIMYLPIIDRRANNTFGNVNIPVELNVLWGRDDNVKNFPELGLGLNLVSIKDGYVLGPSDQVLKYTSKFAKIAIIRAGFRHQKPRGGFMYRVGLLIPIVQDDYSKQRVGDDVFYRIYGGISLGWSF